MHIYKPFPDENASPGNTTDSILATSLSPESRTMSRKSSVGIFVRLTAATIISTKIHANGKGVKVS